MPRGLRAQAAVVAVVTALALTAAACGGGAGRQGSTPAATRPPSTGTPAATAAGATPSPTPAVRVADEPVAFQADDGVTLRGHLYSAAGPRRKVVVFAHMFPDDQRSWSSFAQEVAAQGIAAMTFDFRGYGESGGSRDIARIDRDLEAAVRFMRSRDYAQVYVVGASMGGTAALKVAARQDLAGVVAVSAPVSFMGLDARPDVGAITEPKLLIASRSDPNGAAASLNTLFGAAREPKESEIYDGSAHGTEMLRGPQSSAFRQRLLDFLMR